MLNYIIIAVVFQLINIHYSVSCKYFRVRTVPDNVEAQPNIIVYLSGKIVYYITMNINNIYKNNLYSKFCAVNNLEIQTAFTYFLFISNIINFYIIELFAL